MPTLSKSHSHAAMLNNKIIRRLTPVETCRLQFFPDDWNEWGIDATGKRVEMSDSSRYKQMGNAVTVSVIEHIAQAVKKCLTNP